MVRVVLVGNFNGSQMYWESLTVPPVELPQRSPMYRYPVAPDTPSTGSTKAVWEPYVLPSPRSRSPLQVPVMLSAVPYFCWLGDQPVAPDVTRK